MILNSWSDQKFINRITAIIDANLSNEKFGVSELANELGISRSNLHRKVKKIKNITATQFIKQVHLKAALELLKQSTFTVSEVAYKTGFSSPSYFVKCFHEYFGFPPGEANNRIIDLDTEVPVEKTNDKIFKVKSFAVFFFMILVFVLFITVKNYFFQKDEIEPTLAVLPFVDLSPEEGNGYIINGLSDEILDKLHNINNLRVKSRTDSDKYRDSNKSIFEIADELKVNYILEGSGQKIGETIKLRIQLIDTKTGDHIWSKTFMENANEIFTLQENVALSVASELKIKITGSIEKKIAKLPTENVKAYNLYLMGLEHDRVSALYAQKSDWAIVHIELRKAKKLYEQAIEEDSTFVNAHLQIANKYINSFPPETSSPKIKMMYLDSGIYYVDKVLNFEQDNIHALLLKASYLYRKGFERESALFENKVIQSVGLKYNVIHFYYETICYESYEKRDYYNTVKYYLKYLETKPDETALPYHMLKIIYETFEATGFAQQAMLVSEKMLTYEEYDSIAHWLRLGQLDYFYNGDRSLKYLYKAYKKDTLNYMTIHSLMRFLLWSGKTTEAYHFMLKKFHSHQISGLNVSDDWFYGYLYSKNGFANKGKEYFKAAEKNYLTSIEMNIPEAQRFDSQAELAFMYSALGEKEAALKYFKQLMNRKTYPYNSWLYWFKEWPVFNNIRNEPVFIKTVKDAEAKYQNEHKRIKELLSSFEMTE
jgi:TolB-like protein/AraC-like DNA-binding protein